MISHLMRPPSDGVSVMRDIAEVKRGLRIRAKVQDINEASSPG